MSKRFSVATGCLLVLLLVGCSGNGAATLAPVTAANASDTALKQLQSQGKVPTLDVTTSVTGTDSDGNGVRDDIDKYIAGLSDSAAQKKALTQLAQAVQSTLTVDVTDPNALARISMALNRGDTCVWQQYTAGQTAKALTIEEVTIDTSARLVAYEKYNAARHGATVAGISGSACN
jgi:hypothetical protein